MIYKCTESDREALLHFLAPEPVMNLFVIGDIETYGFDSADLDIWAYVNDHQQITGVLVRYKINVIPVHGEHFDGVDVFLPLIQSLKGVQFVSGKEETVNQYQEFLPDFIRTETYLSECQQLSEVPISTEQVEPLQVTDIPSYISLQESCFERVGETRETLAVEMQQGTTIVHTIKNDAGQIASAGRIAIETAYSAMIVGVGTIEEERGKGYASAVVASLVRYCQEKGKTACLFYNSPAAGRVYHRLGFKDGDKWVMLRKEVG